MFDDFLYARISEDEVGRERNVTRQLRNCRDHSCRHGGRIVAEFYDNDVSALKGAPRPGFDQLMAAVTAANPERKQRRIVVQHTSRLWRNRTERAVGIDTLGRQGLIVLPIDGPELNLTTAAGRMVAGMLGEIDTGESETKAERIRDAARERAQEGRANGPVLYGWTRIYQYDSRGKVVGFDDVVHEEEAAIVREVVKRLLSGESLIAVTGSLNERGIPAPGAGQRRKLRAVGQDTDGTRWSKSSVRKIALRPANVGLRVFHRGREDEEMLPAAWPAIIDFADHDRVVALLSDPSRTVERPGCRQHLLTWGLGSCGLCGANLRMAKRGNSKAGRKQALYVCERSGCVGRNMAAVDELVSAVMVRLLSRPDALDLLDGDAGAAADALKRAAQHRARLDKAAADYAEGLIESAQLRIITAKLKPLIDEAEALAVAHRSNPFGALAASVVGEKAQERWDALSVVQRRAVLAAFGVRVFIDPVTRKGPGFDPMSVRILPPEGSGR